MSALYESTAHRRVLIASANTGGGHRSAALALADSMSYLAPGWVGVFIEPVLEEASWLTRHLAEFYNYLLRHHQPWMKYYFELIQKLRPNESHLLFKAILGYGHRLLTRICPSVIVSVHPMTQHFFGYLIRRFGLRIPLITVVTDPCAGFWRGWACHDVERYVVASASACQQLLAYGIPAQKVQILGMPVHRRFMPVAPQQRAALRQAMGLAPDRLTVFLNAGWIGGGNIPRLYQTLSQQANWPVELVFLAGKNAALYAEAKQWAAYTSLPVHVLGETEEMHRWMQAADLMVSKLGGLTTFEALACHLPVLGDALTAPMPQEAQTVKFIQETGTGLVIRREEDLLAMVQKSLDAPEFLEGFRQNARQVALQGATDRIAKMVLETI